MGGHPIATRMNVDEDYDIHLDRQLQWALTLYYMGYFFR